MDRGILFMLLASLSFAFMGGFAKSVSQILPPVEVTFFRNIFGVLIVGFSIYKSPLKQIGGKPLLLLFRGSMGFVALLAYFYIMAYIPLGEAVTYNKTSPLFVAVLAYYLLGEKLNLRTVFALFTGFMGIVFILKPFGMSISYEHLLGILGGFFAASAYATIKKIKDIYDSRIIVLSFVGIGTIMPAILFLISPYINPPKFIEFLFPVFIMPSTAYVWSLIIFMAIISTLSQWLLTKAYSHSNLSIIGVISYTNIPFSIGIGYMLGDKFPDFLTWLGIGLIILGGFLVGLKKK